MEITIKSPLDMHLHFREGEMLKLVAPCSATDFAGGVIMPNLVPPVDSLERLEAYEQQVVEALGSQPFAPWMTLFFRNYEEEELAAAREHVVGIKLYPKGATTNSAGGIADLADADRTLSLMQEMGIPLLVHGEQASDFVMDREANFLHVYERLATTYPKLMIVMEHVTTAGAIALLDRYSNLYATVTLHHLIITLDDVAGGLLRPHLFCKPIAKRPEDRDALLAAALAAHPKLSFGSDSAPHPISAKECCGCAAGVFSAPVALPILVDLFDRNGALDNLQAFVSDNAVRNYGVTPPETAVLLKKEPMIIPDAVGDVVVYRAGEEIPWSVICKTRG